MTAGAPVGSAFSLTSDGGFSYFLSKEEVSCITDLKKQAFRSSQKETTLSYQTLNELKIKHDREKELEKIRILKSSSSPVSLLKGLQMISSLNIDEIISLVKSQRISPKSPIKIHVCLSNIDGDIWIEPVVCPFLNEAKISHVLKLRFPSR